MIRYCNPIFVLFVSYILELQYNVLLYLIEGVTIHQQCVDRI